MQAKNHDQTYDVIGIGSPLLDLVIQVSDADLARIGLTKGMMCLVDAGESKRIIESLQGRPITIAPGGSAANTLAGVGALGGTAALMGTIGQDENGEIYESHTVGDAVVSCLTTNPHVATGHAITLITPDGERTFATHLGAATQFGKEHVREEALAASATVHIEGYFLEDPRQREAAIRAMTLAKKHGARVSIDLSDPALVGRIRESLEDILPAYADIIFANESEAEAFTGKSAEEAIHDIAELCDVAVVKLGAHGSLIKANGTVHPIAGHRTQVKNTNGAGDMYAAGILYGLTHGLSYAEAGDLASFAGACVVASDGARLDEGLKERVRGYVEKKGLVK